MNEQPVTYANPLPNAMKNGLTLGLLFSANFLLSTSENSILQAMTYAIIVAILVVAWRMAKDFRDKESDGRISFYRSFSYVFLLFFFASLIAAVVKLVYLKYIDTEYLGKLISASMMLLEQAKISIPKGSDAAMTSMLNPINFTINSIMADMFIGMILGLIYASFLSKNNNKTNN